ncbi:MAG: alkaline phosphatase family protein [Parafilimonas sp.]
MKKNTPLIISCISKLMMLSIPVNSQTVPIFSHIVVVIGENTAAGSVFGNSNAPYINALAIQGAKFTNSFAITHPSQPNYIDLYSGNNQGSTNDNLITIKFTSANLGAELINASKTYTTYSDGLPSAGYDGASSGSYARKHNPAANWMGTGTNQIPTSTNQPFTAFPSNYNNLPNVSFVIPDLCHDGHDICPPLNNSVKQYDTWIQQNLDAYKQWCINNNSLLIITYDEDDNSASNKIATVFYGARVATGIYAQTINHYNVLRTLEDANALTTHAGAAATATTINFCWTTTADTQAPTAPANLTASGTTSTGTTLTWAASTDNIAVTAYDVYKGSSVIATVSGLSYTVSGLLPSTAYPFLIKAKDAAGNISAASNTIIVNTLAAALTYCNSRGNTATRENIRKVVLNTINNISSATTGYSNYTAISTSLVRNTAYTITITPSWPGGTKFKEGYAVFIDYNHNGLFTDAGETVFTKTASRTSPVKGTFTIPATAITGATRMRVSLKYNSIPTSCEIFANGEVEDYTVNIAAAFARSAGSPKMTDANTAVEKVISIFPNPVTGNTFYIPGVENYIQYDIINTTGQIVLSGKIKTGNVSVAGLQKGVYVIRFISNNKIVSREFIKE